MSGSAVVSQKISLKKVMRIAWVAAAIVLAAILAKTLIQYGSYAKAQKLAVDLTLETSPDFKYRSYDNKKEFNDLVEDIYDYLNPSRMDYSIFGYDITNDDAVDAARSADKALAKVLNNMGYAGYYGSHYLEYIGYIDYASSKFDSLFITWGAAVFVLLMVTLWYVADAQKSMSVDEDRILCKAGKKTTKEFLVKDVKSVELASLKGLKVTGNGIKYKINLLKNAEELKKAIMDAVTALPVESVMLTTSIAPTSADELKKYKELFDNGVINEEEYNLKKKQLMNL